ncbi:TetR/AcrR family transcriptional regulator [soil metagenome]
MTSGIGKRRRDAQNDTSNTSYQQRRQEIIDAAAHVFKQKGFRGASLGDIANHLGTDRANLYYYVGSKEELFDNAVTEAVENNLARAREIAASDAPAPEKLRILVIDLMGSYEKHFPFLYVFIQENLRQVATKRLDWAQRMRKVNHDYEEIVTQIVQTGFDEGSLKETGPAWVVSYGIIGLVAWTNRWFDPSRTDIDAHAIGSMYADMVLAGLSKA